MEEEKKKKFKSETEKTTYKRIQQKGTSLEKQEREINEKEKQQAKTELQQAKAKLQQAKTELQQAKAKLQQAKTELQQAEAKLQQAKTELKQAKTELQQAEKEYLNAMDSSDNKRKNIAKTSYKREQESYTREQESYTREQESYTREQESYKKKEDILLSRIKHLYKVINSYEFPKVDSKQSFSPGTKQAIETIKKAAEKLNSSTFTSSSYSEYYIQIEKKISNGGLVFPESENIKFNYEVIKGVRNKVPKSEIPTTGAEISAYHPFFRKIIYKTIILPLLTKNRLLICGPSSVKDKPNDYIDKPFSKDKYLKNKTPDVAFIPSGNVCTSFWLVMVGEIKVFTNGSFSNEEKAQAINYAHKILEMQSNRTFVYVFLTDCTNIQFFKATQQQQELHEIFCSPIHSLWEEIPKTNYVKCASGMRILAYLLNLSLKELGYEPITHNIPSIQIEYFLKSGISCSVYKIVTEQYKESFENEKKIYEIIGNLSLSDFPRLIQCSNNALLISPQGYPFDSEYYFTSAHAIHAIQSLKALHSLKIIHRDIRPDNLLWNSKDKILFIDFGFAVNMENFENLKRYEGTTHFASNKLLEIINEANKQREWPFHEPSVKDDLESLIKTFYCLIFPHKARELQGIDKFACDNLLTFWNEVFSNNVFFKELVKLCENEACYDHLIGQFKAFLF